MFRWETLIANLLVGLGALRIHPVRTLLSVLGILIASGSLVATMAVSDGMVAFARRAIERETPVQVVTVAPRTSKLEDGEWVPVTGWPEFTERDADELARVIPAVRAAAVVLGGRSVARYRGSEHRVDLTLCSASFPEVGAIELAAGRFWSRVEGAHHAPVVVLNHVLARDLSPTHDPLGMLEREVLLRGHRVRVIGVLTPPEVENPESPDYGALAPLANARALLAPRRDGRFAPVVQLLAASVENVTAVEAAVGEWLARRDGVWREHVAIRLRLAELKRLEQAFLLMKLFIGALVGISLLVGGIGIMNVLLASVAERTREIGIRKSVGARRGDILAQFLAESVAIALVGAGLGLVCGFVLALGVTAVFRALTHAPVWPSLTPASVLVSGLSSSLVGLVFGTYPARRAADLPPVVAIAQE